MSLVDVLSRLMCASIHMWLEARSGAKTQPEAFHVVRAGDGHHERRRLAGRQRGERQRSASASQEAPVAAIQQNDRGQSATFGAVHRIAHEAANDQAIAIAIVFK